jgi:hypothetical protein
MAGGKDNCPNTSQGSALVLEEIQTSSSSFKLQSALIVIASSSSVVSESLGMPVLF